MPLYIISAFDDTYYVEAPMIDDAIKAFVDHSDAASLDGSDIESIAVVSHDSVIR